MARYTKVLKSLAHNAVGNKRIEAAAPAGNNYYVTGATLDTSNNVLSLARNGGLGAVTVNLNSLAGGGATTPGGNNQELQYNNGGSFGGIDDLKWDGNKLLLGDSSDTGNYLLVEGSDSENTYTVLEGKRKYPKIRLTDTSSNKTQDIWLLSTQLRFGSNASTAGNAAMIVHSGTAANTTFNGDVGIGTSGPGAKLHVVGSTDSTGGIRLDNGSQVVNMYQDASNNFIIDPYNDFIVTGADDIKLQSNDDFELIGDDFVFVSGSTTMMRIAGAGSPTVGVSGAMTIEGNSLLSGNTTITGTLAVTGTSTFSDHITVAENKELRFDSADTFIKADTDNPEDLMIHADDDIFLNADDDVFIQSDGTTYTAFDGANRRVGIGSAFITPASTLHIKGDGDNFRISSADYDLITMGPRGSSGTNLDKAFINLMAGDGSSKVYFDTASHSYINGGNLGIGISSPSQHLHVVGNGLFTGGLTVGDSAADTFITRGHTHLATLGNNVGIGTTSPNKKLEVVGHISASSSTATDAIYYSNGNAMMYNNNTHHFFYGGDTSTRWIANDGSSTFMSLMNSGKLGIGTITPTGQLHVATSGAASQIVLESRSATENYSTGVSIAVGNARAVRFSEHGSNATYGGYSWEIGSADVGGTEIMRLTSEGKLGIGTTAPSYPLHVNTTSTSYAARFENDSTNGYVMQLAAADSTLNFQTDHIIPSLNMHLGNDNVNFYMRTAGYKFGVGTSSPKTSMSLVGALSIEERADHETTNAGWGQLWVKNDSPNKLYFTDDAGTDHDLTAGGSIGGSVSANKLVIGTGTDTLGNFVSALTEDNSIYIGANPASTTSTAELNVGLGINALDAITTGDGNVAIGYGAGTDLNTGGTNTLVGLNSGENLTTGGSNAAFGYESLKSNTTGSSNVAVGAGALRTNDYSWNTAVGHNAARVYTGHSIVAVGYEAASQNVAGGGNTVVGNVAYYNHTGGSSNVAIGSGSMQGDGTNKPSASSNNTSVGTKSMFYASGSQQNVAVGTAALAGASNHVSNYNVAIGYKAASGTTGMDSSVIIGREAALAVEDAQNVVGIGYQALYSLTTGDSNIAIGKDAGRAITTGEQNTIIGDEAGEGLIGGGYNVAIGSDAFKAATSANYNVAIGKNAMNTGVTTSSHNIGIGYQANKDVAGGAGYNIAIGAYAGQSVTTSAHNIFIGREAGSGSNGVNHVIGIGYQAARSVTTASNAPVMIGVEAGETATTARDAVVIGYTAGKNCADLQYKTLIGSQAGVNASGATASGSIAIGMFAGTGINGMDSIAIGRYTMRYGPADGSDRNIAIGRAAIQGVDADRLVGDYNIAIGYQAMRDIKNADNNIAIGTNSMVVAASDTSDQTINNVAIGKNTLYEATSDHNIAIGYQAGRYITTSQYNIGIGVNAIRGDSSSKLTGTGRNVAIGYEAMAQGYTTGRYNVAIGFDAMATGTTASGNTAIGYAAMENAATTTEHNVAVGWYAGREAMGNHNTIVGSEAHRGVVSTSTGQQNVAIGRQALYAQTTSSYNVAVGYQAADAQTSGEKSVALGWRALTANTTGDNNIAIGYEAGATNTDGNDNTLVGYRAGKTINGGTGRNVMVGSQAGQSATTTDASTIIGYQAAGGSALTGDYNTAVGFQSGYALIGSVEGNVFLGHRAGYGATSGGYNTFIGYAAGQNVTTGAGNVIIGKNAGPSSTNTDSNKLYINNAAGTPLIGGDFSAGTVTINGTLDMPSNNGITFDNTNNNNQTFIRNGGTNAASLQIGIGTPSNSNTKISLDDDGKVGIGTNSPAYALDVSGAVDVRLGSGLGTDVMIAGTNHGITRQSNSIKLYNNAKNAYFGVRDSATGIVQISGSNVGINTTSPGYPLHVSGAATQEVRVQSSDSGAYSRIQLRSATDGYAQFNMGDSGADAAGGLVYTHSTDTLNIRAANSNIANVTSTGVGIGTTSPSASLHIYGTGDQRIILKSSSANSEGLVIASDAGSQRVDFSTDGANVMSFSASDNVGIGTTTPNQKLEVAGNITTTALDSEYRFGNRSDLLIRGHSDFDMELISPQDMAFSIDSDNNETTHKFLFKTNTTTPRSAGTTLMTIQEDGKVGIGTTSPGAKLDVRGDIAIQQYTKLDRDTGTNGLKVTDISNNAVPIYAKGATFGDGLNPDAAASEVILYSSTTGSNTATAGKIRFHSRNDAGTAMDFAQIEGIAYDDTASGEDGHIVFRTENASTMTEQMRITNDKVGIGTTSPTTKLDVRGTTLLSGTTTIMGAAGGSSNNLTFDNPDATGNVTLAQGDSGWFKIDSPDDINLDAHTGLTNFQYQGTETFRIAAGASSPVVLQPKASGFDLAMSAQDGTEVLRLDSANKRIGIGTTAPAAPLHISSTETSQLRITSGSNTQCDFKVSQYGGLSLDVNHTLDLDVTRHIDYKAGSSGQNSRLHRFYNTQTQTLQIELESGGGLLDFKGTQGKIYHAATPVAQIKDDTGFIMEDNQGIKNHVATLANFPIDIGTGIATADIQGFSKIQNISLAAYAGGGLPTNLDVKLPVGAAGMEFIVTLGDTALNLGSLTLRLVANGSDVIYNAANAVSNISYTKNIGESIHLICFEANKWSVVAHT